MPVAYAKICMDIYNGLNTKKIQVVRPAFSGSFTPPTYAEQGHF
jgi:hypothetical protein